MAKRLSKDRIDQWYDNDIDLTNRLIWMGSKSNDGDESGTDCSMAERIVKGLLTLHSMSSEPITIFMNNLGGDIYHAFAIYDAIKLCNKKAPVTIKVFGQAMSSGALILQAAKTRLMSPESTLMLHYGEVSFSGHALDAEKNVDESKRLRARMLNIWLTQVKKKDTDYSRQRLHNGIKFDRYFPADEAVSLGLVDGILTSL